MNKTIHNAPDPTLCEENRCDPRILLMGVLNKECVCKRAQNFYATPTFLPHPLIPSVLAIIIIAAPTPFYVVYTINRRSAIGRVQRTIDIIILCYNN